MEDLLDAAGASSPAEPPPTRKASLTTDPSKSSVRMREVNTKAVLDSKVQNMRSQKMTFTNEGVEVTTN